VTVGKSNFDLLLEGYSNLRDKQTLMENSTDAWLNHFIINNMRKMAENHFSNEKLTNQTHKETEGNKIKRDFSVPVLKGVLTFEGFPIPLRILKGGNNRF